MGEATVYVIYIAALPETIWGALTDPAFTKQYFFGHSVESDWSPGSSVVYRMPNGAVQVNGRILEIDPPRLLRFTWKVTPMPELPEAIVSFEIVPLGEVCRLTMTEDHPTPVAEKWLEGGRRGWPIILSGLKSLMEIGRVPEIDIANAMPRED